MVSPLALANARKWILDKQDDSKKKLAEWQIGATFVGIFVSGVVGLGLFLISKPLAISALMLLGVSFLIPLFIQKVPFSQDDQIILAATKRYENFLTDAIFEMIAGSTSVEFLGSILEPDVKIKLLTEQGVANIDMLEVDGEIQFFHEGELLKPNSQAQRR